MTQNNRQRTPKPYGAKFFPKSQNGEVQTMSVRVLHTDVGEFLQTSTHWVSFTKKDKTKGTIRVECLKQGTFGDVREGIHCPLDAQETFLPSTRQWFWVQDLEDGKLKYLEVPFSIRKSLENIQIGVLRGQPLYTTGITIMKQGVGVNTSWQAMPNMDVPQGPFDLQGYLASLGLQELPALVGDKDFPPIWRLTPEQTAEVAQGIMPWQKSKSSYDPTGGKTAPVTVPNQQPAPTPQGYTHLYTPQNTHQYQPQTQPVKEQPKIANAPIPDPHLPHVDGYPYSGETGLQEIDDEREDFEETSYDPPSFY